MIKTAKAGILLGVLVVVWTFVMGLSGWYKDASLQNLFWVVILIQIGVLIWGLKLTAAEGKAYGEQIGAGMLMSLIGGVIIFLGSILFTTVAFPHYFEEIRTLGEEVLRNQGKSEAETTQQLEMMAATQTPFWQAFFGFLGTLVTGLIASLIIAIFVRKKGEPAPASEEKPAT